MKRFWTIFIATSCLICSCIATGLIVAHIVMGSEKSDDATSLVKTEEITQEDNSLAMPIQFASQNSTYSSVEPTDFTFAAEKTVEAVVHVKTKTEINNYSPEIDPFLDFFFGRPNQSRQPQVQEGSGSGVILSDDGYIVTNNHVIEGASSIEVILNNKHTYDAKLIGTDPSTDIALLKIEDKGLPTIAIGNSENLKIGEWVLAVGNPFNLTSTVTAGIVSAKARNINILNAEMKIESFIQTDAAVNPGNSGGALVNTKGELVGINTAIASQTGSYTGYSFAVPTTIVSKVVADLKEFGVVQRAVLGVQIADISDKLAKEKDLSTLKGAYVAGVQKNSSADDANIKTGDIIIGINNQYVSSVAELQEQVSRYRPGDKIKVEFIRNKDKKNVIVELKNRSGNTNVIKIADKSILGATFKELDPKLKQKFRLNYGIQINTIDKHGILAKAGLTKDFIILKVNGQVIYSEEELMSIVNKTVNANDQDRALFITGAYTNGIIAHFAVNLE